MQTIRYIRSRRNKQGHAVYTVALDGGCVVGNLRECHLASYDAFRRAAALRGVLVNLRALEHRCLMSTGQEQSRWLAVVAAGVQAGRSGHAPLRCPAAAGALGQRRVGPKVG